MTESPKPLIPLVREVYNKLYELVGLHRKLLEVTRKEKEALVSAEVKEIEKITLDKEATIQRIQTVESERLKAIGELAVRLKKPAKELTLSNIIKMYQQDEPEFSNQLFQVFNTLKILLKRLSEQNRENHRLVMASLDHIRQMKSNVLGQREPESQTYSKKGKRARPKAAEGEAKLLSQEA